MIHSHSLIGKEPIHGKCQYSVFIDSFSSSSLVHITPLQYDLVYLEIERCNKNIEKILKDDKRN